MTFAACLLLTLGILAYVFYMPAEIDVSPEKTRLLFLRERKDMVYENLRDLNFEYNAGKVPDSDFNTLRASLEDEAAALLAEIERLEMESTVDSPRHSSRKN